jgi:dTDP-4-amino-4,6-dideoxygalactose transaminase
MPRRWRRGLLPGLGPLSLDLRALESMAAKHGLQLIEDATQAHGAGFAGRRVGSSGRLCCFSFYPGKNLGAYGDVGAVTTSDPRMLERLRMLRDHGSPSKYQHFLIGTNGRLDAIQAAVLCVKLKYLHLHDLRSLPSLVLEPQRLPGLRSGLSATLP